MSPRLSDKRGDETSNTCMPCSGWNQLPRLGGHGSYGRTWQLVTSPHFGRYKVQTVQTPNFSTPPRKISKVEFYGCGKLWGWSPILIHSPHRFQASHQRSFLALCHDGRARPPLLDPFQSGGHGGMMPLSLGWCLICPAMDHTKRKQKTLAMALF